MRFSKFLVFLMVSLVLVSEFAVVFRLVPSVKASPDSYTFQPSTTDTILDEGGPNTNYGTETYLWVRSRSSSRNNRAILKFDVSSQIPSGSTINSATLSLYYYIHGSNDPVGRTEWAYRITQTAWGETTATWNKYDGTNAWTTAGGDYTTTDGASTTVPASYGWMNWDVTAQVQTAIDSVSGIAHFLLKDGTESSSTPYNCNFYSREYATGSLCPKLYVSWTSEGAPQAYSLTFTETVVPSVSCGFYREIMFSHTETTSITIETSFLRALWFSQSETVIINTEMSKGRETYLLLTETIEIGGYPVFWREFLFLGENNISIDGLMELWKELKITEFESLETVNPYSASYYFPEYKPYVPPLWYENPLTCIVVGIIGFLGFIILKEAYERW